MDLFQKKTSWYATAVFSLLALAFLVTSFQGGSWRLFQPVVISLGGRSIRIDEAQRLFQQKEAANRLMGRPNMSKEALLRSIIEDQLVALELQEMQIEISRKSAIESLHKNRFFAGQNGHFDEKRLENFLRDARISLQQLIEEEKRRIGYRYLKKAMLAQIAVPPMLTTLMSAGISQERSGGYRTFSLDTIKDTAQPSEKELKDLYAKADVISPHMRRYVVLRLSPALLLQQATVSEQELRQYHAMKNSKQPLEQVRNDLTRKLRLKKAVERMEHLLVKVEEGLGAGKTLAQIAQEEQVPLYELTTDNNGQKEDAQLANLLDFPELEAEANTVRRSLLDRVFELPVLQEPDLVSLPEGENCFIRIEAEIPSKKLSYEQALPILKARWLAEHKRDVLAKQAASFQKHIVRSSMTLVPPMTLNSQLNGIPEIVRDTLFSLEPNHSTVVSDEKATYVIELIKVVPADMKKISAQEKKDLEELVNREVRQTCWFSYMQSLRRKYPLSLNKHYLDTFIGKEEAF